MCLLFVAYSVHLNIVSLCCRNSFVSTVFIFFCFLITDYKEKVLTTSQALNLLKQRGYLIKGNPLPAS